MDMDFVPYIFRQHTKFNVVKVQHREHKLQSFYYRKLFSTSNWRLLSSQRHIFDRDFKRKLN